MISKKDRLVLRFEEIGLEDVFLVGGKNASLGELFSKLRPLGVGALGGFATTARAFQMFMDQNGLRDALRTVLSGLKLDVPGNLEQVGQAARQLMLQQPLPEPIYDEVVQGYVALCAHHSTKCHLAVRTSAVAENLPGASFAGQHDTYLNVYGSIELCNTIRQCYASLFTDRAIEYRARNGFDPMSVSLSVAVQHMVNVNDAASGVMFTLDPESGFRNAIVVTGTYGLGEYLVQGEIVPDQWTLFKPALESSKQPILGRKLGSKDRRLIMTAAGTARADIPEPLRRQFCLRDSEVITLAKWAAKIESHYSQHYGKPTPMDIEWAKDDANGDLVVIQARPVHLQERALRHQTYQLLDQSTTPLATGQAVGEKIASGPVRVVNNVSELGSVQEGEVLVTRTTDPDWEPAMRIVAAIITEEGGRTAHAAIISRELGIPCMVGVSEARSFLKTNEMVTVSCAEGLVGKVYKGALRFEVQAMDVKDVPEPKVPLMLNIGDPDTAFSLACLPNSGVGLARIEFIINSTIGIHPMALAWYPHLKKSLNIGKIAERIGIENPQEYFVSRLASGIAKIAAAFFPKPVIVRMSDFKTSEYALLLGGDEFEPLEENPMLGFRGASRYYDVRYEAGFAMECMALRRVREDMGFANVKVMIPFCRTVEEGKKVLDTLAKHGLAQGRNGLEVYAMCEVPSNVILAKEFLDIFDGYSIGSNDLTQLLLGIDRDSGSIAHLFDENNPAVRRMIASAIHDAREMHKPIGICGQAPSDFPDFAEWLAESGISSISLNPDSLVRVALRMAQMVNGSAEVILR